MSYVNSPLLADTSRGVSHHSHMPEKTTKYRAEVGGRLRLTREALGLNQGQLGEILGVGGNAVTQYEKGKRLIDPGAAVKLKQTKAVSLDWIYAGDPSSLPAALFKVATTPKAVPEPAAADKSRKRKIA